MVYKSVLLILWIFVNLVESKLIRPPTIDVGRDKQIASSLKQPGSL